VVSTAGVPESGQCHLTKWAGRAWHARATLKTQYSEGIDAIDALAGRGCAIPWRRPSWVRIPPPAPRISPSSPSCFIVLRSGRIVSLQPRLDQWDSAGTSKELVVSPALTSLQVMIITGTITPIMNARTIRLPKSRGIVFCKPDRKSIPAMTNIIPP
jgi:hypothetical protein